ncbi:protein BREAST CANCER SUSCEPTIBILITY 1 homolog isoform X2 [Phalaenopsis equestris]|uniref:protein BREAST CANCER SUSCEPTIBILITY 1 homolog isoform X2 n=1 Tax=Phalaenopsis equestris TaxID=78828 RepID=UPI0009E636F1|nr:protein BREAST CANCER SUSCEPTIBILITY 1 homolog isoform X2 [Phalaenopsis equestris]
MMDIAHLEKMGRELKCPICLSLLKDAVTLACNHVFCNSCIVESMKSVSSCPVCKVPFRRREVRPAPHMDNLVSIYKSMEAASGFNISTSQVSPPKNAEKPSQVADYKKTNALESTMMSQSSSKGKRLSRGKRKTMEKVDSITSNPCPPTRPSFSSNKRIHVTPYPISETPISQKRANKLVVSTNEDTNIIELQDTNDLAYKGLEDSTLQPFFWLREANDEDEGLERTITPEMTSLTTPKSVPCFSDIKDSDDDSTPKKLTPMSKAAAQEAFDSEMFEWTQRACSPELFSTPPKKQKAGGKRFSGFQEDKCGERFPANNNYARDLESSKPCQLDERNKTTRNTCKKKGTLKKRRKQNKEKTVEAYTHETATISLNEDHQFGSNEIVEGSSQEKEPSKQISLLRSKRKVYNSHKFNLLQPKARVKRRLKEFNGCAEVNKQLPAKAAEEIQNQEIKDESMTLASHGKSMEVVDVMTKGQKRSKKVSFKSPKLIKRLSLDCVELKKADANILSNPSKDKTTNNEIEKANSRLQLLSCKQNDGCRTRVNQNIQMGVVRKGKQRRPHMQDVDDLSSMVSHKKQHSSTNNLMPDIQTCMNLQKCCLSSRSKELPHPTMNEVTRICKNIHSPIRCAFCHSSNDLEVSGEMMHYCDGKSVDEDHNGGVNVIHSHKNCTEWAPDVYFEEDLVINLSTELSRSRRITCSCCGIKGAALGCFEKSCRRSFHYPCAKQTPECRWDYENFVMLCPLHSSSKLPSEMSELQKLSIKASASKGKTQLKTTNDKNSLWAWPAGLPCKWVLCSSGLSGAEKEILSEFARLTGISISKAWSSAVTHVIASTDDNGSCKRTLKFLMGILCGKWILSIKWIKACMKFMKPVDEEKYEITVDVHGIHNGPRNGRMRIINKEPKLFSGFCFYFSGDFVASFKGYLQDLITEAGGKVLQRRPISRELTKQLDDSSDTTFIVYSLELPENNRRNQNAKVLDHRKAEAIALAEDCGAKVVTNSWILDSIAASTLQVLPS